MAAVALVLPASGQAASGCYPGTYCVMNYLPSSGSSAQSGNVFRGKAYQQTAGNTTTFTFQWCLSSSCAVVAYSRTTTTTLTYAVPAVTYFGALSGTYYWRIRASNPIRGVTYSAPWIVKFCSPGNCPPSTPTKLTPAAAAQIVDPSPTFTARFNASGITGRLDFQLCTSSTCTTVIGSGSSVSGLAPAQTGSWKYLGVLPYGTYYWRVRAYGSNGKWSSWATASSFTVIGPGATLRPMADRGASTTWYVRDASCNDKMAARWAAIDEDIDAYVATGCGPAGPEEYMRSRWTPLVHMIEMDLTDTPANFLEATALTVRARAWREGDRVSTLKVTVRLADGTPVGAPTTWTVSATDAAYSYVLSSLTLTKAQTDGLYVTIEAESSGAGSSTRIAVAALNLDVTYTPISSNVEPLSPELQTPWDGLISRPTQPQLTARYQDPDVGDTGTISYEVCGDAACSVLVTSGTSGTSADEDDMLSWTPGAALDPDTVYYWRARSYDGQWYSPWSEPYSFRTWPGGWFRQSTLPPREGLNAVGRSGTSTYAVGDGGVILLSRDDGARWKRLTSGTSLDLRAVVVEDPFTAFVAGDDGIVLSTTDGGATWNRIDAAPIGVTDLRGIASFETTDLWVAGAGGKVFYSEDAGGTWVSQATGSTAELRALSAFGGGDLIAVGDGGEVLWTGDGGTNWVDKNTATIGATNLLGVATVDDDSAWLVGAGGAIFRSTDTGATWTSQTSGTTSALRSISAFSASEAFVVGDGGTVAVTTNSGTAWALAGLGTGGIGSLHGASATSATNVTVVGSLGLVATSADSGTTWGWNAGAAGDVLAVSQISATTALAAGPRGSVLRTADSGASWQEVASGFAAQVTTVDAFNATAGYAGGAGGQISITGNGGTSWTPVTAPGAATIDAVSAFSATAVASVFYDTAGRVAVSANSGSTWNVQASPTNVRLADVEAVDANIAIAVGPGGAIVRTTNTGVGWGNVVSGTGNDLRGVSAGSAMVVYAVGANGTILKSINAGAGWGSVSTATIGASSLRAVHAVSATLVFVVGDNGVTFRTVDGGTNWVALASGTTRSLRAVSATAIDAAFAGGVGGIVLGRRLADATQPYRPVNVSPLTWTNDSTPTLTASAYSDPNSDAQNGSEWQVRTDAGTYGTPHQSSGVIGAATSWTVTNVLTDGAAYWFQERYRDTTATWSQWSVETRFRYDGSPPTGASVSYPDGNWDYGYIDVVYDSGTDAFSGVDPLLTRIERQDASWNGTACQVFSGWGLVATGPVSPWRDTVADNRCVRYRIVVYDVAGNSATFTNPGTTITLPDGTGPSVPQGRRLLTRSTTSVGMQWDASIDNRTPQASITYDVEYSQNGAAWGALCTGLTDATRTCTRSAVQAQTPGYFRVRARDLLGFYSAWGYYADSYSTLMYLKAAPNSTRMTLGSVKVAEAAVGNLLTTTTPNLNNATLNYQFNPGTTATAATMPAGMSPGTGGQGWFVDAGAGAGGNGGGINDGPITVSYTTTASRVNGTGHVATRLFTTATDGAGSATAPTTFQTIETDWINSLSVTTPMNHVDAHAGFTDEQVWAFGESLYLEAWLVFTIAPGGGSSTTVSLSNGTTATIESAPMGVRPGTPTGEAPGDGFSGASVPTLQATYSHPSAIAGHVVYEIYDDLSGAPGTLLETGYSALEMATATQGSYVPVGLTSGATYHWRARSEDRFGRVSGWTTSRSFTVTTGGGGTLSVTLDASTKALTPATLYPGTDGTASTIATINTDNPSGYALSATDVLAWGDGNGLKNTLTADYLPDWTGTDATPSVWAAAAQGYFGMTTRHVSYNGTNAARLAKWGAANLAGWPEGDFTNNRYAGVPKSTSIAVHDRNAATAGVGDQVTVTWRGNFANAQPPGAYFSDIVFTVVANP